MRQELWALIDRLRSEGVSILMSTHYIEEAERLADTVVDHVPRQGGRQRHARPSWCASTPAREAVEVYGPPARLAEVEADARARRRAHAPHRHVDHAARRRTAQRRRPEGERRPPNLEDVFVLLTGEEIA